MPRQNHRLSVSSQPLARELAYEIGQNHQTVTANVMKTIFRPTVPFMHTPRPNIQINPIFLPECTTTVMP